MSIEFVSGGFDETSSELAILEGDSISYGTFEKSKRNKYSRLSNPAKLRPMSELLGASSAVVRSSKSSSSQSTQGSRSGGSSSGSASGSRSQSQSTGNASGSRTPVVVPVAVSTGNNDGSRGALVINPADGSRGVLIVPVSSGDGSGGAGYSDSLGVPIHSFGLNPLPNDPHGSRGSNGDGSSDSGSGDGSGGSQSSTSNRGGGYAPGSGNDLFLGSTGKGGRSGGQTSVFNNKGTVLYSDEETEMYAAPKKALHIPVKLKRKGKGKFTLRKDPEFETVLGYYTDNLLGVDPGAFGFRTNLKSAFFTKPKRDKNPNRDRSNDVMPGSMQDAINKSRYKDSVIQTAKFRDTLTKWDGSVNENGEMVNQDGILLGSNDCFCKKKSLDLIGNSSHIAGDIVLRTIDDLDGLEGDFNRILDIKIKHLIQPDEMPRVREYLENIARETQLLGDDELAGMSDQQLGSFFSNIWKGVKKAATGVWKGVKSVGKFIGKNVGAVAKGVWSGVKAVGNVVGKVASTIGKGLWAGVSAVGNGLLAVGKFAWQNALPLLSGVVSFLPGGSLISGLIDTLTGITSGNPGDEQMQQQQMYDQQMQQQMYDQQMQQQQQQMYDQQMQQQMYDQQMQQQYQPQFTQQYEPQFTQQYEPQYTQQYQPQYNTLQPSYYQPEEYYEEYQPEEYYADYQDIPQDEYTDYNEENYDPQYYEEEVMGNLLTDIKTAITKGVNWIKDPVNRVKAANFMNLSAQEQIRIQTELKNLDAKSKEQIDAWQAELGLKSKGDSFFSTYGTWIALGLVGVILIMNR